MQEHRSSEAKNAVVTPLRSHVATPPSTLPHEEWRPAAAALVSSRKLKKEAQLVVVAAMKVEERMDLRGRIGEEFAHALNLLEYFVDILLNLEGDFNFGDMNALVYISFRTNRRRRLRFLEASCISGGGVFCVGEKASSEQRAITVFEPTSGHVPKAVSVW
nr:conserved hypothetical protein [Ipomoea batatas]